MNQVSDDERDARQDVAAEYQTFYPVVYPGSVIVTCNRSPLSGGIPMGVRAYRVLARDKAEAKEIAKVRYGNGDPSDDDAWIR